MTDLKNTFCTQRFSLAATCPAAWTGSLVVSAMLLVLAPSAAIAGGEFTTFSTNKNPPAHTAWGNFETGFDDIVICQEFLLEDSGAEAVIIDYDILLTSPGGSLAGGSVSLTMHSIEDGLPGDELGMTELDLGDQPPATFPDASWLSAGPGFAATVTTNISHLACARTGNTSFHIPGFFDSETTILFSSDGGESFSPVQGWSLGIQISGHLVEAEPACESDTLAQGGAGPGSNDAEFNTNIDIFNNSDGQRRYSIILQKRNTDTPEVIGEIDLGPWEMRPVDVSAILDTSAFGSISFECEDLPKSSHDDELMVQATISASLPSGEQYGQIFNAGQPEDAQQAATTSLLFTTHDPERFRVNLGVTAVADGTSVTATPKAADGSDLASGHTMTFDGGGNTQINDIHGFFNLGNEPNVTIEMEVSSGAALSYVSVLDGSQAGLGTSDPTTILPSPNGSSTVSLLELGPVQGFNEFSGSATVHNHGSRLITVTAKYYERSNPGAVATTTFPLESNETLGWDNVVGELFGLSNTVGTVVLDAGVIGRISAVGREFAQFRDDQGNVTGTAGQLMPGLTSDNALTSGSNYHFLGLTEKSDANGDERSHLAMFNPGSDDVTILVTAFDASGAVDGQVVEQLVRGEELIRINSILSVLGTTTDGQPKRLVVTVDGPIHVLAYRVNSTGDPVTLSPYRSSSN